MGGKRSSLQALQFFLEEDKRDSLLESMQERKQQQPTMFRYSFLITYYYYYYVYVCVFVHVAVLCCIQVHVDLNVGTFPTLLYPLISWDKAVGSLIVSILSHHLQLVWPTQYYSQWVG